MKKPPSAPRPSAVAVADPDLPERAHKLLRAAESRPGQYLGEPVRPLWAAAPVLVRGGAWTAGAAFLSSLSGNFRVPEPTHGTGDLTALIDVNLRSLLDLLHSGLSVAWPLAAGTVVLLAGTRAAEAVNFNGKLGELRAARKRYVQPAELVDDAQTLLARTQQAKKTVLTSTVHRKGMIDRQRNELSLPVQEWEVAEALREYSRLVKREPAAPKSTKVTELLDTRRRALQLSLAGIERRVSALEAYAEQVTEADERYAELRQIQQLADGSNDVLELLARTARDDLAVAEIEGMTGEAAAVSASFTAALESAKEAAVIALPARKTA
ncbi:hypothetical protein [Streptomyces sp. MJM1172]|uniref:hypothetical protein n=1 Tax=Streptomyces sp. MJM1172 TaxID=1703926 RepID=UPI00093DD807|nr:hypothetical protein [Streptomyces sp. MJM1172]